MIRIRRVYDATGAADRAAVEETQRLLRDRFPGVPEGRVQALPQELRHPDRVDFRPLLYVAETSAGRVRGFALMRYAPDLHFVFLDFIAAERGETGGVGGALYERVRDEARALGARGIFLESLPDDPELEPDAGRRSENRARLRFYARWGALPIEGTRYETPVEPGGAAPLLVYDGLGGDEPLNRGEAREIVRAILERRYGDYCPPDYVERVVGSFEDDPVRLRAPAGRAPARAELGAEQGAEGAPAGSSDAPAIPLPALVALVVNEGHEIHHVRERGYVEAPVRIPAILRELDGTGAFRRVEPSAYPDRWLERVHDPEYVRYLKRVCEATEPGRPVYPYVFPIRNASRPPKDLPTRAGYYCIDTFTPLDRNAYRAARGAVDCALTAAEQVLEGSWTAYALVRPPGHHAERRAFGGFCYFNSAAVAAERLSEHGPVAVLDVDYHHGNGQQDIFWERGDVLTVSIHGHPNFAYPYFSGFEDETGAGAGAGANLNIALPEKVDGKRYARTLRRAMKRIADFDPLFLVVALGLDPARNDPTGTWSLLSADFRENGRIIGAAGLPTLVVQEGGYRTRTLGLNARHFFAGLTEAARAARAG